MNMMPITVSGVLLFVCVTLIHDWSPIPVTEAFQHEFSGRRISPLSHHRDVSNRRIFYFTASSNNNVEITMTRNSSLLQPSISSDEIYEQKTTGSTVLASLVSALEEENDENNYKNVNDETTPMSSSSSPLTKMVSSETIDDPNINDDTSSSPFFRILPLIWGIAFLSSLDRVAMSVAILPLSEQYGYTDAIKGQVSSLFSIGYGLMIIPSGLLVAFLSPSRILFAGLILWSLGTILTPYAAYVGGTYTDTLVPLLAVRCAIGASEAVVLPSIQKLLINWIPTKNKSIAIASVFASFQSGTIGAYVISPELLDAYGWEGLFYIYGVCGLMYSLPLLLLCKDLPPTFGTATPRQETVSTLCNGDDISSCSVETAEVIEVTPAAGKTNGGTAIESLSSTTITTPFREAVDILKSAPWKDFAKSKAIWAMIIAHAANNVGLYNNLSWTPTFYAEQYGLNVRDSALLSVLPSVTGAACGLLAGTIADKILKNYDNSGGNADETTDESYQILRTNVRKIFQGIALYGPAMTLFVLSSHIPDEPWVAQSLLMATLGLQAFNAAGYGAANQEKAGSKWSGLLYSLTSLPGVMIGSAGVYATGQILDITNQDWSIVFQCNAIVNLIGATAFVTLYDGKREFD